ncbi:PREDICTED: uncharacterized protein LOC108378125 [Rhagoletis zephyria]|uniref:uncharacterized protein LOC108378125 n=1 Tax=Rhagoletis zephyria TaxID=28612 RepID=UPI00081198A3|nr:PREDICTED: uncharacterized protein LOC108378125 [Rhagoletis zephyria]
MLNTIRKDDNVLTEILINLQNRIRLIKEELINIRYAVQWAKHNIINSVMLSKEEVELSISKLREDEVPFKSAEEALELSKVNVFSQDMKIVYMVKIPLTLKETFGRIIIRPVKRINNIVIKTEYNEILKGKYTLFGIKNKCESYNDVTICKETHLVDLSKDLCVTRIINSLNSTCSTTNGHHVPTLEEIKPGVILLNQFNGKLEADETSQEVNGTHVIIFYNSTIKINSQTFSNIEIKPIETIPAILQPIPLENDHIELLSLEALKDLHINNTHRINSLKKATFSVGSLTTAAFLIIIVLLLFFLRKRSVKIQYVGKEIVKPSTSLEVNPSSETNHIPTYVNLNNSPFY